MDHDVQHDPDLERRLIAQAAAEAPDRLAVARAARDAKRAMRQWQHSSAVAGRIGVGPTESDDSSRVWRMARWPLAAAAVIVAGLVGITQWQTSHRSVEGPVVANAPTPTAPTINTGNTGRTTTGGESHGFARGPYATSSPNDGSDLSDADVVEEMAELFVRPSITFDASEADAWSSQLSSLEQLANLDGDTVLDDVFSDWSAFDAGS